MDGSEFDGTGDEVLNVGAPPPRRPARITVSVAAVYRPDPANRAVSPKAP